MSDLLRRLEAARVRAAEEEVIASIPADILTNLAVAQAKFKAAGGCPGCGSMILAVHEGGCPAVKDDIY